jgi:hypothetical protein
VASSTGPCGESQAGAALDAADRTGAHLPAPGSQSTGIIASNLSVPFLRGLRIERFGPVWASDITYIPMTRWFV